MLPHYNIVDLDVEIYQGLYLELCFILNSAIGCILVLIKILFSFDWCHSAAMLQMTLSDQ